MPFYIGAVSGQRRELRGLSAGGDGAGLPTAVLCFRAAFFERPSYESLDSDHCRLCQ
jgi:hypothetical protein